MRQHRRPFPAVIRLITLRSTLIRLWSNCCVAAPRTVTDVQMFFWIDRGSWSVAMTDQEAGKGSQGPESESANEESNTGETSRRTVLKSAAAVTAAGALGAIGSFLRYSALRLRFRFRAPGFLCRLPDLSSQHSDFLCLSGNNLTVRRGSWRRVTAVRPMAN